MIKDNYLISGIQQMGVGVHNADEAFQWYREHFGMDVPIFKDSGEATLMAEYTGGKPHNRYAILAMNLAGGGGFEIWQFTDRENQGPKPEVLLGDLGINAAKIKCKNLKETKAFLESKGLTIYHDTPGEGFYVKDPYNNWFQLVESTSWFNAKSKKLTGGIHGAVVGVSNLEVSIPFYQKVLKYDIIKWDKEVTIDGNRYRKVLLAHTDVRKGAFSELFCKTEIELIQSLDRKPNKTYENRYWGDPGFIHLCFDVIGMDFLKTVADKNQTPFTVDSDNSFDMGEAAGRFSYIEDPDGTLIEFVETHKVPIMKKWGLYFNLKKRNPEKPLPRFMVKALGLSK
tara:strand:+ start:1874 stop:2896 length:1023 start_codon:yes stop_codon:yes gene_type:complete